MKRPLLILSTTILFFASCGPAAESREVMHSRAKTISDSMANLIRTAMAEAEMPGAPMNAVKPDTVKSPAAASTTVQPPQGK